MNILRGWNIFKNDEMGNSVENLNFIVSDRLRLLEFFRVASELAKLAKLRVGLSRTFATP